MKFIDLFENWGLVSIKLNLKFAEAEFKPNADDEVAAWEMYVELITRVTTQPLAKENGDDFSALESIYKLYDITRDILKRNGRKSKEFTKIAVIVLNLVVRPFTSKWHKILKSELQKDEHYVEFRSDLLSLQTNLDQYARVLASIAKVDDLTNLYEETAIM